MRFTAPKSLMLVLSLALLASTLQACSGTASSGGLKMMPMDKLPPEVRAAPSVVQASYQFAAANPDVMKSIPCYCGCGSIGHTSNYSCYVKSHSSGSVTWDDHALGCSLCVEITQDTMRLLKDGKTVPDIKAYVDSTYAKYGTSNMP